VDLDFLLTGFSGLMLAGCGIVMMLWMMFVITRLAHQFSGNEIPKAGVAAVIMVFAVPLPTCAVFILSLEIVKNGSGPAILGLIPAAIFWSPLALIAAAIFQNGLKALPNNISQTEEIE